MMSNTSDSFCCTADLHVALCGDDRFSGRSAVLSDHDGPFRTLERAKAEIARLNTKGDIQPGGITVWVHEGQYFMDKTLVLDAGCSGTADKPVRFMAAPHEKVSLVGGILVSGFSVWQDQIQVADLDQADIGDLYPHTQKWRATLPLDNDESNEVYFNGIRQDSARWPNSARSIGKCEGWEYLEKVNDNIDDFLKDDWSYLYTDPERMKKWRHRIEDMQVRIYSNPNWSDDVVNVDWLDVENGRIHLKRSDNGSFLNAFESGARYFVKNVFEELDVPGEYYIDREARKLYYWPEGDLAAGQLVVTTLASIIEMNETGHIRLEGFELTACRGNAVVVSGGTGNTIAGCHIHGTGSFGLYINGGTDHRVTSCDIHDIGRGGVYLKGGDRLSLEEGRNEVDNCDIYDYGKIVTCYMAGVKIDGVANRVSHCHIHHAGHFALVVHEGCDNVITHCEINDVCLESADTGSIYLTTNYSAGLGNLTMWGNQVLNCFFHDIYGYGMHRKYGFQNKGLFETFYESPYACWAIYMDDFASGIVVKNNIFARCPLGAIELGGGRGIVIENNIMVDCIPAIHMSSRWIPFGDKPYLKGAKDALEYVRYDQPPYSEKYPLKEMFSDYQEDSFRLPKHNRIANNVVYYHHDSFKGYWIPTHQEGCSVVWQFNDFDPETFFCDSNLIWHEGKEIRVEKRLDGEDELKTLTFSDWIEQTGFDKNTVVAEPGFVDSRNDLFELKETSPAFKLGFKPINMSEMGLVTDEHRKNAGHSPASHDRREIVFRRILLPFKKSVSYGSINAYELAQRKKELEQKADPVDPSD